jgi:DinB superfamily
MIEQAIRRLNLIIDKVPSLLAQIGEEKMSMKPSPAKWSKKEIIGHLIDSATNNHHRFVRGQFEKNPEIFYDQNKWNTFGFYQEIDSNQIINFWKIYNIQLLEIIKRIPSDHLNNQIRIGGDLLTLEYSIVDYVDHMEHHLRQIVEF